MNIEASLPEVGARVLREQRRPCAATSQRLRRDVERALPATAARSCSAASRRRRVLRAGGGRIRTYALPVPRGGAAYVERVFGLPGVAAWVADALAERDFLAFEEPYRTSRDG